MYEFFRDPGADGVGVAFTNAAAPDGSLLSLGGAHGKAGRAPGLAVVEADLGVPLAIVRQVHGTHVEQIDGQDLEHLGARSADALLTRRPGVGLAIRVADCVPVLLADAEAGVVAAVHAGRVGLAAGVLQASVSALRAAGADRIVGWIGPHICGACYEVPEELAHEVAATVPDARSTTSWGTPALDLGAGAAALLHAAGVPTDRVGRCTREHTDLHSYRRDGAESGRQAGIIWLSGACRTNSPGEAPATMG